MDRSEGGSPRSARDEQGAVPFDDELRFDDRGAYEHQPRGTRGTASRRGGATPRGGATAAASRSAGPHAGLTRVEKALLALDPKGLGLEIAPTFRPIALAGPAAPVVRDRRGCA